MAFVLAGASGNYLDLMDDLETFVNSNGWTTMAASQEATAAVVSAGGSGYSVNDKLTLVGGSGVVTATVLNVETIGGGGAVLTASVFTSGHYHYEPEPDPVATTGGGGTGATFNMTWTNTDSTKQPKRLILKGTGSGSEEIYVGIEAQDFGGGIYNWRLWGMTGFHDQVDFYSQPGLFSGIAYVPLNDGATTHWFFVNPSRIIMIARMGTSYMNMYLGLINRFGTSVDYPYPLMVGGCSTTLAPFSDSTAGFSGMNDPNYHSTSGDVFGPMILRTPGGAWIPFANAAGAFTFRSQRNDAVITPPGRHASSSSAETWDDFNRLAAGGSPVYTVRQTPDTTASSNYRFPLIPCMLSEASPQLAVHGELDNIYWSGTLTELAGQATTEDIYSIGGQDYILFQNCNRTDHWANFLIKKE